MPGLCMTKIQPHLYFLSFKKRFFDLTFAVSAVAITWPLWIVISICTLWDSGWPVFFIQERSGYLKRTFRMWKFRTMRKEKKYEMRSLTKINEAAFPMFKIANDPRYTKFGKWLSSTGLDELPQIINILKNEMSLIGPRPLPVNQSKLLSKYWDFRYLVKPGIISAWSIHPSKHKSLKIWRSLEVKTIKFGSVTNDLRLVLETVIEIWFKRLWSTIVHVFK